MAKRKKVQKWDPVRAFTFSETKSKGIHVHDSTEGGKCIRLGGTVEVPLAEGLTNLLHNHESAFLMRVNGATARGAPSIGYNELIDRKARSGNIISENWVSPDRADAALTEVRDNGWGLERLDYNGTELVEATPDSCLLHVNTVAPGGELTYWSNAYEQDKLVQGQVKRQGLKDFTQAVGVDILKLAHGPNQEVHSLLRLHPGASFRLQRTTGAWSEVILSWNGSWLFQRFLEEQRRQAPRTAA